MARWFETICEENHIWVMWKSGKSRKISNKRTFGDVSLRKWRTKEIFNYYQKSIPNQIREINLRIPTISQPCVFNVQGENKGPYKHISRDRLPPYVLGALLGDGSLTKSGVRLSSADPEIPNYMESTLKQVYGEIKIMSMSTTKSKCSTYRIKNAFCIEPLEDLGLLGKKSHNKFIPRIYLLARIYLNVNSLDK